MSFVQAAPAQDFSWKKAIFSGENDLILRAGGRPNTAGDAWEGSPTGLGARFQHRFENRLRLGFTLEKDAGESFFSGSNRRGFDFWSAHFFTENEHKPLKILALGDFSARLGQGLLLQNSFGISKSPEK